MNTNETSSPNPINQDYDSDCDEQLMRQKRNFTRQVSPACESEISSQKSVEVVLDESKLFPGGNQPELRSESEERRYNDELKKKFNQLSTTTKADTREDGATVQEQTDGVGTKPTTIKKPKGRPPKSAAQRDKEAADKALKAERAEKMRNRAANARKARELYAQRLFHEKAIKYVEELKAREAEANKPIVEMQKKINDLESRLRAEEYSEYETETESEYSEPGGKQDYTYNDLYYTQQPKKIVFY